MKNSALLRIIIWSVVLVILLAVAGLAIGGFFGVDSIIGFGGISVGNTYRYSDPDSYLIGEFSVESASIKEIELDWIAGSVNISVGDGDEIVVSEKGFGNEDERLRYRIKNGKIDIKFRKNGIRLAKGLSKDLNITLPAGTDLDELDIDMVSSSLDIDADLTIDDISIDAVSGRIRIACVKSDEIDIENVSGGISVSDVTTRKLSVDNVSGNIDFRGTAEIVDIGSVSGGFTADFPAAPKEIDIDTVSGGGRITMPKDKGIDVDCDGVSGRVWVWGEKCPKSGGFKIGDSYTKLKVDTVSGDVTVEE